MSDEPRQFIMTERENMQDQIYLLRAKVRAARETIREQMSDDIHIDEYRSVVGQQLHQKLVETEPNVLTYEQSVALAQRDKFFIKCGIAIGLSASAFPESNRMDTEDRIEQVYRNRLNLNRKNGIKL